MNRPKDDLDRTLEKILKDDPSFQKELDKAERAWDIAFQIISLREKRGLTQNQLAKLVGTSQSNIARVENAEYRAYSLKTLEKIAKALKAKVNIMFIPEESKPYYASI